MKPNNHLEEMAGYFQVPPDHLWRWGDGGRVLEDSSGLTICFREELESYLDAFEPGDLPYLLPLVLLVAACKDNYREMSLSICPLDRGIPEAERLFGSMDGSPNDWVDRAWKFLGHVRCLPKNYRTGPGIHHLLNVVFTKRTGNARTPQDLITTFKSGVLDVWTLKPADISPDDYFETLEPLIKGWNRFQTLEALQNELATGLQEPPKAIEIPIPEVKEPDENTTLLDELEEDPRTVGIAALARHIIAALNIPMQARGSNDLPLGGVSDITNRGNFDRLLLSELANDDLTLVARLANNEALYLRREQPPVKIEKERIVLVDTTIKLWGTARAFAVSAALACQERNPLGNGLQAFALGGTRFIDTDLSSKEGVLQLLGRLDVSLHAAEGLGKCLKSLPNTSNEVILVTGAELLDDPAFAPQLIALQTQLDYLITVARDGKMRLIEVVGGHRKLLAEATFDLQDLLFRRARHRPVPTKSEEGDYPAFFVWEPAPIYFPSTSLRLRAHNCNATTTNSILVLTDQRRVLWWSGARHGAQELFPYIQKGIDTYLNQFNWNYQVLSVTLPDRTKCIVYVYDRTLHRAWEAVLEHVVPYSSMHFDEGILYYSIRPPGSAMNEYRRRNFAAETDEIDLNPPPHKRESVMRRVEPRTINKNELQQTINPGYSVLQHVKYVRISADGLLIIDGRTLRNTTESEWRLVYEDRVNSPTHTWVRAQDAHAGLVFPHNPELRLRRLEWKDGTMGWVDPRGFLHLRSSNPELPQLTIVLVLDVPTAIWASNGDCTGSSYFIGYHNSKYVNPKEFNQRYLHPLLQKILSTP